MSAHTSAITVPGANSSPSFRFHDLMVPTSIVGDRAGIGSSVKSGYDAKDLAATRHDRGGKGRDAAGAPARMPSTLSAGRPVTPANRDAAQMPRTDDWRADNRVDVAAARPARRNPPRALLDSIVVDGISLFCGDSSLDSVAQGNVVSLVSTVLMTKIVNGGTLGGPTHLRSGHGGHGAAALPAQAGRFTVAERQVPSVGIAANHKPPRAWTDRGGG